MSSAASGEAREGRARWIIPVLLTLLAAVLRLPGLSYGLWIDEIGTVQSFVRLPLVELLTSYPSPNHHILNSALAHVAVQIFGETPWAVRLPAYLFGVATVPALYLLARAGLSRREAVGAGLVLAASYHHAYFSQNARGYTGYIFFTVLGTWFLVRALRDGDRRAAVGFAVAGALNVYVLLSGLFAVVAQVAGALLMHVLPAGAARRRRLRLLGAATAGAALLTLVLYAPVLGEIITFYRTAEGGEVGWRLSENLVGVILDAALPTRNPVLIAAGLLVGVPVLGAGAVRLWRRLPLAWFAFLLPPLLELGVTLFLGAGSYPRRFIVVVPLAVLVGVTGVHASAEWLERRIHAAAGRFAYVAGIAAGVVAVGSALPRLYTTPKQPFDEAVAWVEEQAAPGDLRVGVWVASTGTGYYDRSFREARTPPALEELMNEAPAEARVWLVTTFRGDMARFEPDLLALVEARFSERRRFPGLVGGGDVTVWEGPR